VFFFLGIPVYNDDEMECKNYYKRMVDPFSKRGLPVPINIHSKLCCARDCRFFIGASTLTFCLRFENIHLPTNQGTTPQTTFQNFKDTPNESESTEPKLFFTVKYTLIS
jgi:hypothetical protein